VYEEKQVTTRARGDHKYETFRTGVREAVDRGLCNGREFPLTRVAVDRGLGGYQGGCS